MTGVDCSSEGTPCDVTQRHRTVDGDLGFVASARDMAEVARHIRANRDDDRAPSPVDAGDGGLEETGDAADAGDAGARADDNDGSMPSASRPGDDIPLDRDRWKANSVELSSVGDPLVRISATMTERCAVAAESSCRATEEPSPTLIFDRPAAAGVHALEALHARLCSGSGMRDHCEPMTGVLAVRTVAAPCVDSVGGEDLCGRFDADITVIGPSDLALAPSGQSAAGHATLFYRDEHIRTTCQSGSGCGKTPFGP